MKNLLKGKEDASSPKNRLFGITETLSNMKIKIFDRLKNVSITKKLYCVVGTVALLITLGLFTLWFSISTLSSLRAFIGAESLWSKAQKDAVYHLEKYSNTHNEADYKQFQEFMKVPFAYHKALVELICNEPNIEKAHNAFIEGHNHPKDADGMIKLFTRFKNNMYVSKAINTWIEGDSIIPKLIPVGEKLHNEIHSEYTSPTKLHEIVAEISIIDDQLTVLEDRFSFTLGEGARWLESEILEVLFVVAIVFCLVGLIFAFSISIQITSGIKEIVRIADKVSKVDFSERAEVFSKDEIGHLALAFNKMVDDLQNGLNQKSKAEDELKQKSIELVRSNSELEQFAYIASHDLQEPLRMVTSYVQLLESRYKDKLDKDAKEFIAFAVEGTERMRNLIHSLLEYSRVNNVKPFERIHLNLLLGNVLKDLSSQIKENNAVFKIDILPDIDGDPVLIAQLFQNLISNAVKFRNTKSPEIEISGKKENNEYLFSVKDNGIGIPKEYTEKIFLIFNRLHSKDKYPGVGMGLAICKKIVELHGGKIWVESEVDKGSAFYFTIKGK